VKREKLDLERKVKVDQSRMDKEKEENEESKK
jgi:hypothetical protein